MGFLRNFNKINKNDVSLAGGKGASLGEMTQSGILVPPGFVILANAFEKFLEESNLDIEIESILDSVNHKELHSVENASEKIEALILGAKISEDLTSEIQKFFDNLGAKYVAVRSSATAEDSANAAWAGQLKSSLNTTEENLLDNVKSCWASLFTSRAIFYRFEKKLHKQKISVAVVVQKMVESEKSGIAFSVHPVTQDRNQLIIEAGFGLGEAIVSGQITPDSYVVEKQPLRIIDKNIQTQSRGFYRAKSGGNEWHDIPKEKGKKQALSDKEILELSEKVISIEKHYGFPVDVEWAFEQGKFYIVQSRPITTLRKTEPRLKRKFTKEHAREYSLFRVATWYRAMNQELPKIIGESVEEACAVYRGEDLVEIYYEPIELKRLFGAVIQNSSDKNRMSEKIESFISSFKELKKYFTGEKLLENVEELRQFQERYASIWAYIGVVFMIPALPVDEELKHLAYAARSQTQEYNEIFTGNLDDNLEKLGIILEEEESVISGKAEVTENEIKGQVANKGQAKGIVRIVSSTRDFPKVKEGDILVVAMTMPKYLPAMKKAAAFITDEGGLTSHAAIVSREMNKPCIVGTKVATKLLRDGNEIEVDADNGIVRILKK